MTSLDLCLPYHCFRTWPPAALVETKGFVVSLLATAVEIHLLVLLHKKKLNAPRGRIITIVAAVVGGVSLLLIIVILYFMRRPTETSAPSMHDQENPSTESDIYFPLKDGLTFQDLVEATNNFDDSFVLGRGACGTVYKAAMRSGKTIAVKKLASNREGSNVENSFRAEILTLGKIRHRNIVKLYGFCYHEGSNLLLYEYMARGSLGELLHDSSRGMQWSTRFMPLEQGGDLVTWARQYVREHSLTSGILDERLELENQSTVAHMIYVLKVALLCTSMSPSDRPSMREVVLMLIESNEREGNLTLSSAYDYPLKGDTSRK
ncbi:hypothetical protein OIU84_023717 [Salix udensis]|uniref:non-specific serine/threonine protein kinase n=1 Tax=Salix udensis TaxID=889485 RepID=A0AAD6KRX5_9ROSI|nr:hypothetical protein OIU84_023717 [Salix udensis]